MVKTRLNMVDKAPREFWRLCIQMSVSQTIFMAKVLANSLLSKTIYLMCDFNSNGRFYLEAGNSHE